MIKAQIYTLKGTKTGEQVLPKDVFEQKINIKLLAQANHVYEERGHVGLRNTKTRSEVNRTTKKLYAQKGTGGARHGSRRANLFVGGGIVFGPRPLRRILSMPQGLKKAALVAAFSVKAKDNQIVVVSGVSKAEKTKEISGFLKKLTSELKTKRFTFFLSEKSLPAFKSLRNLDEAGTILYKNASAFDVLQGGTLVLDQEIFENKVSKAKTERKGDKRASA